MDLKSLCLDNIAQMIKQLPPMLRDEVIGESSKVIKKEAEEKARKKIMKEIHHSSKVVVEDITERIIQSYVTGRVWKRPEYTRNIDEDLYNIFVDISENFVSKNAEKLLFNGTRSHRRQSANLLWDEYSSSEEE